MTELIAVTPEDLSTSHVNKLSASGDDIIRWPWPIDQAELDKFIREASAVLRKAGG
jgi:hypothetical protein